MTNITCLFLPSFLLVTPRLFSELQPRSSSGRFQTTVSSTSAEKGRKEIFYFRFGSVCISLNFPQWRNLYCVNFVGLQCAIKCHILINRGFQSQTSNFIFFCQLCGDCGPLDTILSLWRKFAPFLRPDVARSELVP